MPAERGVPVPYLKARRLHTLLKQEELAEKAHIARATVVRGEAGGTRSIDNVRKLAAALGITPERLRSHPPDAP